MSAEHSGMPPCLQLRKSGFLPLRHMSRFQTRLALACTCSNSRCGQKPDTRRRLAWFPQYGRRAFFAASCTRLNAREHASAVTRIGILTEDLTLCMYTGSFRLYIWGVDFGSHGYDNAIVAKLQGAIFPVSIEAEHGLKQDFSGDCLCLSLFFHSAAV